MFTGLVKAPLVPVLTFTPHFPLKKQIRDLLRDCPQSARILRMPIPDCDIKTLMIRQSYRTFAR